MSISDLLDSSNKIVHILAIILTLVQFAPIKINPWTWIGQQLGKAVYGKIMDHITSNINKMSNEIDGIEIQISKLKTDFEYSCITTCKVRIMRFGDELLHNISHTKEHYIQILQDIVEYETYCKEHPDFKDTIEFDIKKIKESYMICLENHSFLQ